MAFRNINGRYDQGDVYNRVKRPGVITTQSYLRFEKSLQGTFNSLTFDVLVNQGSASATERRLQLTDTFTIVDLSVMLYNAAEDTNTGKALARLYTWDNPAAFSQTVTNSLLNFYNGYLQLRVNTEVLVDSLDIMQFYRVHTTQTGSPSASIDEWPAINNGFKKIVPTITLNGAAKNDISLFFPQSINMAASDGFNYAVCYCRGFLNQNAAQLNPGL